MYKTIKFDIKAVEPLKLGKFKRDTNNEYSYSYIPGSVLKGAIAWSLIEYNNLPKELLNGKTVFYNAYPMIGKEIALPMMRCFGADKQKLKSKDDIIELYSFFYKDKKNQLVNYKKSEFVIYDGINVKKYDVDKVEKLHINKKAMLKEDNTKMFRYEAVDKGQSFKGRIKASSKLVDDIVDILKTGVLYLGGSRGNGYGRCEISNIECMEESILYKSDENIENSLYIYFISDAILYYNGEVKTYIPEEELKKALGIRGKCEYVESCSGLDIAASYNSLYQTNNVCYSSVSKGSVIKYNIDGPIGGDVIKSFIDKGVGLRREDGYGEIAILKEIPIKIRLFNKKTTKNITGSVANLDSQDEEMLFNILKNIFSKRLELRIDKLVMSFKNDLEENPLSNSQIGKLLTLFNNANILDEERFKEKIKQYLTHMQSKKGKATWHQLDKFKLKVTDDTKDAISLQRLLRDYSEDKNNNVFLKLEDCIQQVGIGKYKYPVDTRDNKLLFDMKNRFLVKLFRYCLNMKGVAE